jgi:predicted metal-binding protein
MTLKKELEAKFRKGGFMDFKWIDPVKIVVSQWVRLKCMYGCGEYGRTASCPPNVPTVAECERFFREYKNVAVFHFAAKLKKPEARHAWTRKLNLALLKLEKEVFLSGHEKAFLLFLDSCNMCDACAAHREACKEPRMARPTPEAMGVDVFATVRAVGSPIEVLSDYRQTMNRYAFLLID